MNGCELSEADLRVLYASLVEEAIEAFTIDLSYATEICLKARAIEARKKKRQQGNLETVY